MTSVQFDGPSPILYDSTTSRRESPDSLDFDFKTTIPSFRLRYPDEGRSQQPEIDLSRATSFHQSFWIGEEGGGRGNSKSAKLLGISNADAASIVETRRRHSQNVRVKSSRLSRMLGRGTKTTDFELSPGGQ